MTCKKSLSESLKEKYSEKKPKKTFKERAAAFGTKAAKAYNSVNKGLDTVEGFIYGKPKKKTPARKPAKKPAKKTAARTAQTYPRVVYVPYPIYPGPGMPKPQQRKKTGTAKKKTTKRR